MIVAMSAFHQKRSRAAMKYITRNSIGHDSSTVMLGGWGSEYKENGGTTATPASTCRRM